MFTRVTMVTAAFWILLCIAAIKVLAPLPERPTTDTATIAPTTEIPDETTTEDGQDAGEFGITEDFAPDGESLPATGSPLTTEPADVEAPLDTDQPTTTEPAEDGSATDDTEQDDTEQDETQDSGADETGPNTPTSSAPGDSAETLSEPATESEVDGEGSPSSDTGSQRESSRAESPGPSSNESPDDS